MASAIDLKDRLTAFVAEQRASLAHLEDAYVVEKTRLTQQIQAASAVLTQWDAKVELLIDTLATAGIKVKTEN